MSAGQHNLWSREELLLALNLYAKLPFGQLHHCNPNIIKLAERLGRTNSSVAMKLVNFAAIDPSLDRKGLSGCSKLDREVWHEYLANPELILKTDEEMRGIISSETCESQNEAREETRSYCAEDREQLTKVRTMQWLFRKAVLTNFDGECCISGIRLPELLVASHIVPWMADESNRLNPQNGLCLNALHDKAFDQGLITLDDDYKVVLSSRIQNTTENELLIKFRGQKIHKPQKFMPSLCFLKYHQEHIFQL